MDIKDKKYLLGLKLIPSLNARINKVLEVFGTAQSAWSACTKEFIESLGVSREIAEKVCSERNKINLDLELERLNSLGIEMVSSSDSAYPALLREIASPPIFFVKGDLVKSFDCAVAIVGSRRASAIGRDFAYGLAQQLSELGITVVSGVARGIDTAAHHGALLGNAATMGVLGCGLDVTYPPENKKLYCEIEKNGSLISEYPLGTQPWPQNFPARNRIISGLSEGVVVVEASEKSGALITADFALEQGRDVMVVPGNVRSQVSKGCHKLIKQGAHLIDTVDDVVEILQLEVKVPANAELAKAKLKVEVSTDEQEILTCLGWEPKHIDQVIVSMNLDISKVSTLLTILELKGLVKQDFGHNYVRIR